MKPIGIIYSCLNLINGKRYIGQTIKTIEERKYQHLWECKDSGLYFHNALKKYGPENFLWEIIDTTSSLEELNQKEIHWISELKSLWNENGYNISLGGSNSDNISNHPEKNKILEKMRNTDKNKEVFQYSLEGKFENSFRSAAEAERQTGISATNIVRGCLNKAYQVSGYIWSYSKELSVIKEKLKNNNRKYNWGKHIDQFDKSGNYIATYPSIVSAEETTGISSSNIIGCLKGKNKTCSGFMWKYNENQSESVLLSTDWHLAIDNVEVLKGLVRQKCEYALKKGIKTLFCLGDIFDSRKAQPLSVLDSFQEILDMIEEFGLELYCIAGNHDRTSYSSESSYLLPFEWHLGLNYIPTYAKVSISENTNVYLLSFFEETLWMEYYRKMLEEYPLESGKTNILLTHTAFSGSVNNDKSKVDSNITPGLLKDWTKVLAGHYHNAQQVSQNIFHIPSIQQNNFGENSEKGFTVLKVDASTEFVKSDFKEYVILELDAGKIDAEMLGNLISEADKGDVYLRTDLVGNQSDIKSIDTNKLKAHGIRIKTVSTEIVESVSAAESGETVDFESDEKVQALFKDFCSEKGFNHEEGLEYLNLILR